MKNIVIIGSGSDLSKEFVQQIDKNEYKDYLISREESMDQNQNKLTVDDYENELNSITAFIDDISNPYLIFFNGYLKENRPKKIPSDNEVLDTFKINF